MIASRTPVPTVNGASRVDADGGQKRTRGFGVPNISAGAFAHPTSELLVFLSARDARFFQIKLALDLAAGFVGDLALAQQAIDVVALGGDQIEPHMGAEPGGIPAFIDRPRKLLTARFVSCARQRERVVRQAAG